MSENPAKPGFQSPAPAALVPARPDRAVVVFAEETRLPKLRRLKPGFRHCYAYMAMPGGWVGIDPLAYMTEIKGFYDWPADADLATHLRGLGQCALTVPVLQPPRRLAPPLPFSCVEVVKRLIGLQSWSIRTPWELFLHLRKICLDDGFVSFYIPFR
ncbi:MAG: hypothetical protein OJJ21_13790 [Ferrovibrio sp.]|uniref:hypothetical protein n=1 Tax=Ferrovibrio sp. TaxID=1917215 RepID=UPI00261613F4|nr:hypothetical protein [Ferrovibrio sp.]MCW0234668.1 hypothetical protein [Ferrovibrio sp.]